MTTEDTNGAGLLARDPSPADVRSGWWPSPWTAAQVAAGKVSRAGLLAAGGIVYWCESRPDQGGRQVVVGADPSEPVSTPFDVSPAGTSVRSRVHEYGGGAATVDDGVLVYVDQDDQAWHRLDLDGGDGPVRLEPGGRADSERADSERADSDSTIRHADGRMTVDGRWLISVEERVAPDGATTHRLVATPLGGTGPVVNLVDSGDFVAAPRPSPDGSRLAWVTWDHPDMPWVASRLQVATLVYGEGVPTVVDAVTVAGGPGVSVGQPRWTADGSLLFVDDRTGWWLPYRIPARHFTERGSGVDAAVPLVEDEAEFHSPDWVFGQHTFAELADGSIVACRHSGGRDALVVLRPPAAGPDASGWSCVEVAQPCVSIAAVVSPDGRTAVVLGSTVTESQTVIVVDPADAGAARQLCAAPTVVVPADRASVSIPRVGTAAGHPVHGLFFPPVNPDVVVPDGPPPLVVFCHGGPTAAAEPGYDPVVQFFTSRGIAVAAVDYRGSSGYGRAYRDLLRGAWGAGDVDDCVAYARALAADGLVDGDRMAIRGTSAGGLTALAALVRAQLFAGAVAWYGVTDLITLAADTHDFESHYTDWLVGPLPEAEEIYRDRSPINHTNDLVGRVLLLQGSADAVVPASQSERFADELRAGGVDCRMVVFEGEGHGFRRAETIGAALTAELGFYRELFSPGDDGGR